MLVDQEPRPLAAKKMRKTEEAGLAGASRPAIGAVGHTRRIAAILLDLRQVSAGRAFRANPPGASGIARRDGVLAAVFQAGHNRAA
jgi:hypothetical protein